MTTKYNNVFQVYKTLSCGDKVAANQRKTMKILYNYLSFTFFCAFAVLLASTITLDLNNIIVLYEWRFDMLLAININFPLILDKPGLLFSATVCFISANVLLFSSRYIDHEKENGQFLLIIFLFILSINLLIFIPHIIFLLLGWDGLGLVRFLLVIHYPSPKSLAAGYITVLTNRIGDALIIVSIPLMLSSLTLNPSVYNNPTSLTLLSLLLITAAITKRAQIPFSSWLPAAIAAPTPISALVHSSTLVTAGVFLMYRFYPLLRGSPYYSFTLLLAASLTILIAGLAAFKENDIKKIIALSTLSQLGVMIFSLAINLPELAYFHILTHATFKALLFIAAGNIILQRSHTQDLRQFGNTYWIQPISVTSLIIANISLIGFPFIAGFFSKDLIIEIVLFNKRNILIFLSLLVATIFTLLYSIRFIYNLFYSNTNNKPIATFTSSDKNINIRLVIISTYVIVSGALTMWSISFPYIHPSLITINKFLIFSLLIFSGLLILPLIKVASTATIKISKSYFTYSIWFINYINSQFFIKIFINRGFSLYKNSDAIWIEIIAGRSRFLRIGSLSNPFFNWQDYTITGRFLVICLIILTNL